MNSVAYISEIFSSLQGEGPHTGEPMTFIRFAGCSLSCRWCDTERASVPEDHYGVETPPRSRRFINYANPAGVAKLNEHLTFFTDPVIAVTGGEPLEQTPFLEEWLGAVSGKKVLLETNGTMATELAKIARYTDIISMDMKLPSSTGRQALWNEHAAFLSTALGSGKELYVKIVITPDTLDKDIQEAIKIISSANKFIPVILQPASQTDNFPYKINDAQIQSFARLCNLWLPNVSVMSQAHKTMGWL